MMVSELQGLFMKTLISQRNVRRILEIGCFTGSSALWMAQGFREYSASKLITLELDVKAAEIAKKYFDRMNYKHCIELIIGPAKET
jgi:caffeoyl-CoA O-methyltransferase